MMVDPTESRRRRLVAAINARPGDRADLERDYGQVWDTDQLTAEFEVRGFLAPFVLVTRKADGRDGAMTFQHSPRYFFDFQETAGKS